MSLKGLISISVTSINIIEFFSFPLIDFFSLKASLQPSKRTERYFSVFGSSPGLRVSVRSCQFVSMALLLPGVLSSLCLWLCLPISIFPQRHNVQLALICKGSVIPETGGAHVPSLFPALSPELNPQLQAMSILKHGVKRVEPCLNNPVLRGGLHGNSLPTHGSRRDPSPG